MNRPNISTGNLAKLGAGALGAAVVFGLAVEALESARDFGQLALDPVFFGGGVPRGDGHPVVALPGWLANDRYLRPLLGWLGRVGYTPVPSGIKRNTGRLASLIRETGDRVEAAVRENSRPATLVGHSLGGVIARGIARQRPEIVRQVITISSPLNIDAAPLGAPLPLIAIYTRDDRIVRYPRALAPDGARNHGGRSIEVSGCHCGMAFNAQVYRILGQLLAENQSTQ